MFPEYVVEQIQDLSAHDADARTVLKTSSAVGATVVVEAFGSTVVVTGATVVVVVVVAAAWI